MEGPEAWQQALTKNLKQLRNNLEHIIDVEFGLLGELLGLSVLSHQQIKFISSQKDTVTKNRQLLNNVINSSGNAQKQFLVALNKTQQKHVNNFIISGGRRTSDTDNWPIQCSDEIKTIEANWPKMIEQIDSKYGFLDELLSVMCITRRHKEHIEVAETSAMKNERLLDMLRLRSVGDYSKFIRCLVKTKQQHVAFLLAPDTAGISHPLNDFQRSRLTVNHAALVSLIDTKNGLLAEMYAADCITRLQKEAIESATTQAESNRLLLDIVARGCESDFDKFVNCLCETGQEHLCRVLFEEGVVQKVVARFSDKREVVKSRQYTLIYSRVPINVIKMSDNVKHYETCVVNSFMNLLKHADIKRRQELLADVDELRRQLSLSDIHLFATNSQHSIGIFFFCNSFEGLMHFEELYSSGLLQAIVLKMFAFLCVDTTVICSSFKWDISEYTNGVKYFSSLMGLSVFTELYQLAQQMQCDATECCNIAIDIEQLPFELIEMLLIRAACQLFVILNRMTPRAEIYTMASLSAVSSLWWRTLTYRQYNKQLLKRYFRKVCGPYNFNPQQLQSLNIADGRNVWGVAELNNKLYVACGGSNTIQVFTSRPPFSRLEDIKVEGLKDPNDIIVCSETSQLYIADRKQCAIWRVNLLSYKQVDKFITTRWRPYSLSIKSRRLLITPYNGDALFIYGDDGVQLNRIPLPNYMWARQAVESSRNTYIVSHLKRSNDDTQSDYTIGVSEVDIDGRIIRQFNNQLGLFNEPYYLLIDASNHVIVADGRNERIVLLKPDLQLKRVLIMKLQGKPFRMCFNEKTGLLFVGCLKSTEIRIFSVTDQQRHHLQTK